MSANAAPIDEWRSRLVAPACLCAEKAVIVSCGRSRKTMCSVEVEAGATHGDWVEVHEHCTQAIEVLAPLPPSWTDGAPVRLR